MEVLLCVRMTKSIWIANQYNDEDGRQIKKDDLFLRDYQMLVRWIKKNVSYQEVKKGEYLIKEYASDELVILQDEGFILTL